MSLSRVCALLFAVRRVAAVGQLVLKYGMTLAQERAHHSGRSLVVVAATSPWIPGGLAIFGCSAVAWLFTLSRVSLTLAYPFNALGYIGILTASVLFLHERANAWTWMGTLLVAAGLVLVVTMAPGSS
jgi:drug/metabolite transporter (DMT)-like permease